jgi:flotillin
MELERQRATTVTQAVIAKESAQQKADAELYSEQQMAEGRKFAEQAEAEASAFRLLKDAEANFMVTKQSADASYYKKEREAEAELIIQQKQAEGLSAMAKAYGDMATVLGGPQGLMQYLYLQNNTYERLANANAQAIHGLQPKINVWNTGAQGDGVADPTAPIRNLFQSLPPLLSTIHDQTGLQPPSWLAQMPQDEKQRALQALEARNGSVSSE